MVFVYTNIVLFLLLLVFGFIFLFWKKKWINIGSGAIIIFILILLQINTVILSISCLLVISISINYLRGHNIANVSMVIIPLLLVPIVLLSFPVSAAPPDGNPGVGIPDFVRHVGSVTSQPGIDVSGTDYVVGDNGKLQAYLTVGSYPVSNAACYISVLYPNMTFFINNDLMLSASFREHFDGLYYLDFVVPNATGVYPVSAYCFYNASAIVNNVSSVVVPSSSYLELEDHEDYFLMDSIDSSYYRVKNKGACNNINCSVFFNISLPIGWSNSLLSDARLLFNGKLDDNKDDIYFYVHDGGVRKYWFNIINKNVIYNKQFFLNSTFENESVIRVEAEAYDWDDTKLSVDYLVVSRVYNGSYVGDLRGNDELAVSSGIGDIHNVVVGTTDIISLDDIFSIILILFSVVFLLTKWRHISGIMLISWAIFFGWGINNYLSVIIIFFGVMVMYNHFKGDNK